MPIAKYLALYGASPHNLPKIAGSYSGNLIICGDAACIWRDLEMFKCKSGNGVSKAGWDFMCVNRAVETFPGKIEHGYSNAAYVLRKFLRSRRDDYQDEFGRPAHNHCIKDDGWCIGWPWVGHGTSGLGAILTGIALGYERVVLAGMPLDNSPHNGEPPWRVTRFTKEAPDGCEHWKKAIDVAFEGKVKSLSGRTKDWLGCP